VPYSISPAAPNLTLSATGEECELFGTHPDKYLVAEDLVRIGHVMGTLEFHGGATRRDWRARPNAHGRHGEAQPRTCLR
jgi:hypothetical protein